MHAKDHVTYMATLMKTLHVFFSIVGGVCLVCLMTIDSNYEFEYNLCGLKELCVIHVTM